MQINSISPNTARCLNKYYARDKASAITSITIIYSNTPSFYKQCHFSA